MSPVRSVTHVSGRSNKRENCGRGFGHAPCGATSQHGFGAADTDFPVADANRLFPVNGG